MLKIGLTGGIGCGKSTVAKIFAELNIPVLDADEIAHSLVEKGQPALTQIRLAFGPEILNPDGSLNRKSLRERVFSDLKQKQKLESILHPLIYQTLQAELEQLIAPYCIISIPLLFEAFFYRRYVGGKAFTSVISNFITLNSGRGFQSTTYLALWPLGCAAWLSRGERCEG